MFHAYGMAFVKGVSDLFASKSSILGAIGGAIATFLFGGVDFMIKALAVVMALDIVTGIIKGYVNEKTNSRRGSLGMMKKFAIMCVITVAHQLDSMLGGTPMFRNIAVWGYFAVESISILENLSLMGLWIPKSLRTRLEQLKMESDEHPPQF